MLRGLNVECNCGRSVEVEGLNDFLDNEDYSPAQVKCACGERYEVILRMNILGKEKPQ